MGIEHRPELTILFADIAGSVALHENLGDVKAHKMIVACLNTMGQMIVKNQGRVVETIGDEIMCSFNHPDSALHAACAIQEAIHEGISVPLSIRIGFHNGPTSLDNGHPFGDTVNVAARMVALAKAGQIMISQHTHITLSQKNRQRTRHFNRVFIKGKQSPFDVHEIMWDEDDRTKQLSQARSVSYDRQPVSTIHLTYNDQELVVSKFKGDITLGRGETCKLVIPSEAASRSHAIITYKIGKMVLTDQSTNGTYIRTRPGNRSQDSQELFIHHEEWTMASSGFMSLGQPIEDDSPFLVYFRFS